MPRKPRWRDGTKLSRAGYLLPCFRISLPSGDAVIEHHGLPVGTAVVPGSFHLRCSSMGIYDAPLKATEPIAAQKEAIEVLRKRFLELQALCDQNLETLIDMPQENFVVADASLFEQKPEAVKDTVSEKKTDLRKEKVEKVPNKESAQSKKRTQKDSTRAETAQEKEPRKRTATKKTEVPMPKLETADKPKRTRRKTAKN